jgi:DnaK suppressor protein
MDVARLKERLIQKEREFQEESAALRTEAASNGAPDVGDPVDVVTAEQGTSEALEENEIVSGALNLVRNALQRIGEGTYGRCLACGREIEPARLEAVPWAEYCLKDQQKRDRALSTPGSSAV